VSNWAGKSPLYTAVALVALGFIIVFLGWNGAAGKDYTQGQIPYLISGGITGLGLILCGLTVVIVQAVRREAMLLASRLDRLAEQFGAPPEATGDLTVEDANGGFAPRPREPVGS
jgi:hypothetical protein